MNLNLVQKQIQKLAYTAFTSISVGGLVSWQQHTSATTQNNVETVIVEDTLGGLCGQKVIIHYPKLQPEANLNDPTMHTNAGSSFVRNSITTWYGKLSQQQQQYFKIGTMVAFTACYYSNIKARLARQHKNYENEQLSQLIKCSLGSLNQMEKLLASEAQKSKKQRNIIGTIALASVSVCAASDLFIAKENRIRGVLIAACAPLIVGIVRQKSDAENRYKSYTDVQEVKVLRSLPEKFALLDSILNLVNEQFAPCFTKNEKLKNSFQQHITKLKNFCKTITIQELHIPTNKNVISLLKSAKKQIKKDNATLLLCNHIEKIGVISEQLTKVEKELDELIALCEKCTQVIS